MRKLLGICLFLCSILSTRAQELVSGGVLKPEQANMDIRHYLIDLKVDPEAQTLNGYVTATLLLKSPAQVILFDLSRKMKVSGITVDKKTADFVQENDMIRIAGKNEFAAGRHVIKISYGGSPIVAKRPPWDGGIQWEKDSTGNPWIALSCEGEGGKIYFPCKDHPSDEPDEGAEMRITVPKGLVVAGPGLLKKTTHSRNSSTFDWKTNYPISNYCLLFNVGKYVVVKRDYTTINNNHVPMEFYVLEEHKSKAEHHLDLLERSAQVLEKYFGEYPWVKEKIGIAETPHLGMEHQTMNAYGNKFNYTKIGGKDFDWLMHHEFGHEWWANKITNRDWADMWIQEGFCAYGDALYTRDLEGEEAYRKRMKRTGLSAQNKVPIVQGESGIDAGKAYHGDIYGKAAFFVHSLRFFMGDSIFFPTLKKFATDSSICCYNTVTTSMVDDYFSAACGQKLTPLFDLYLRSIDKLEVSVKQLVNDEYIIKTTNLSMALPIEIQTDKGISRVIIDPKGSRIKSTTMPVVDPQMFYLKKITFD